jgi:hypothetical protein
LLLLLLFLLSSLLLLLLVVRGVEWLGAAGNISTSALKFPFK